MTKQKQAIQALKDIKKAIKQSKKISYDLAIQTFQTTELMEDQMKTWESKELIKQGLDLTSQIRGILLISNIDGAKTPTRGLFIG